MIRDLITHKRYDGEDCPSCHSKHIYVVHTINSKFPDDVSRDKVYCRCRKCRKFILKNGYLEFDSVEEAIDAWNKRRG